MSRDANPQSGFRTFPRRRIRTLAQTMESRKIPRLYFIGEVVVATGYLGGFQFSMGLGIRCSRRPCHVRTQLISVYDPVTFATARFFQKLLKKSHKILYGELLSDLLSMTAIPVPRGNLRKCHPLTSRKAGQYCRQWLRAKTTLSAWPASSIA